MSVTGQLISAVRSRKGQKVAKLLEEMDVDEVNGKDNGETAIHVACKLRNNEALDLLLSKPGIDVNVRDSSEATPLHKACNFNNVYAASKLLDTPQVDVKRKRDLNEKQTLEKQTLVKKYKEEETVLDKKHKEEETMLEETFAKEEEIERRRIIILKERRDEIVQNVQKKTNDPGKDTSSDDHNKIKAAKKSLECPICMELMKPPTRIWMCRFTHMICEQCRDHMNGGKCPTCTTQPVTQRAFMAENLARTIFGD